MKKSNRFLATISITLCLSMTMGIGSVFATENVAENSEEYTVTQSATEITSMNDLVSLALSQASQINVYSVENTADLKILTATQILEKREFANGKTETDIAVSQIIPEQEVLDALARGDSPASDYASGSVTGHTVGSTIYYTVRTAPAPFSSTYTYRVDKLVTNIVKTSSTGVTCSSGRQGYKVSQTAEKWQDIYYNNSATPGTQQTFTLVSSHSGFYEGAPDMAGASESGVFVQVELNFSNGEEVNIQFNVITKE